MVAGFSGAGDKIPAPAQEASRPGSPCSKMARRTPASASSSAMAPPMSPPPAMTASKFFVIFFLVGPSSCCAANRIASERACQLLREHFCFLRCGSGAGPVSVVRCVTGFGHETAYFRREILLRGVQRFSLGGTYVAFRDAQALAGLLLRRAGFRGGQLWSDLRHVGFVAVIVLRRIACWYAGPHRDAARDGHRRRWRRNIER